MKTYSFVYKDTHEWSVTLAK